MNIPAPFFLLGNPRSGTSLLRLILNSHPEITVPPECGFLQWWHSKYSNWNLKHSLDDQAIETYIQDLQKSKKIEGWNYDFEKLFKLIKTALPKNYGELSSTVYLSYSNKPNQKIGDKNNYYINHIATLKKIYPTSKFIHLVRDGRDVACSYMEISHNNYDSPYVPQLSQSIDEIAKEWSNNVEEISNQIQSHSFITIRYEDLLKDPKKELSKLCEFLELEYDSQMMNYHRPTYNDEPNITLEWKKKTLSKIDNKNFNKFLSYLKPHEIELFNGIARKQLKTYNYL